MRYICPLRYSALNRINSTARNIKISGDAKNRLKLIILAALAGRVTRLLEFKFNFLIGGALSRRPRINIDNHNGILRMHPISYATRSNPNPANSNCSRSRRNDVSDGIQQDYLFSSPDFVRVNGRFLTRNRSPSCPTRSS